MKDNDLFNLRKNFKTTWIRRNYQSILDYRICYKKGNILSLYNEKTNQRIEVTVNQYSSNKGFDYVSFKEFSTLETITPFIGWLIQADRDKLPPLENGYFYYQDLIGLNVYEKDKLIGHVKDIEEYSASKTLRIELSNGKDLLLPFVEAFIENVDLENKRLHVRLIKGMIE